jgi:WD40 repeat protein
LAPELKTIPLESSLRLNHSVSLVNFSPDGKWLAAANNDGRIHLVNKEVWRYTFLLDGMDIASSLQWTPDSRYIVAAGGYADGRLWDVHGHRVVASPITIQGWDAAISGDRRWLASEVEGGIQIRDLNDSRTWSAPQTIRPKISIIGPRSWGVHQRLAFSPKAMLQATCSPDNSLVQITGLRNGIPTGKTISFEAAGLDTLRTAYLDDEGRWFIFRKYLDEDPRLTERLVRRAISTDNNDALVASEVSIEIPERNEYTISPDGSRMAVWKDNQMLVYNLHAPDPHQAVHVLLPPKEKNGPASVLLSNDNQWLFVLFPGTLSIWDLRLDDPQRRDWPIVEWPSVIATSPDNARLAIADDRGEIRMMKFDGNVLEECRVLRGHEVTSLLTISGDHRFVAAADYDGPISLWRVSEQSNDMPLKLYLGDGGQMAWMSFTQDNRWLIVQCLHKMLLWPLDRDELMDLAGQTAGRELTADERTQYQIPQDSGISLAPSASAESN